MVALRPRELTSAEQEADATRARPWLQLYEADVEPSTTFLKEAADVPEPPEGS